MRRPKVRILFVCLMAVVNLTCGKEQVPSEPAGPSDPVSRVLTATLTSRQAVIGGIVFRVSVTPGGLIDSVIPACDCDLFIRRASELEVRGVILGDLYAGVALLEANVTGPQSVTAYTFQIDQVAERTGVLRTDPGAYTFTVNWKP